VRSDRIEQLISTLRIKPRPDSHRQGLLDIARACDQRRAETPAPQPGSHRYRWVAGLAIAAGVAIAITCLAVNRRPAGQGRLQPVRPGASQPMIAEIVTVRSLEKAFSRGGLDEIERQLDRAFHLVGPWPTADAEQGLM
jgi:hypothetical protein